MRNRFDTIAAVLGVTGIMSALVVFGILSYTAPDTKQLYDPLRSGDQLPRGFRQLLSRDAIRPIYDPQFVTAEATPWHGAMTRSSSGSSRTATPRRIP